MPHLVTSRPHVHHPWMMIFILALLVILLIALMLAPSAHA
jgi:hypothetical protein